MTRIELSRLTSQEKDALILALLGRVAALEGKLNQPPRTPDVITQGAGQLVKIG